LAKGCKNSPYSRQNISYLKPNGKRPLKPIPQSHKDIRKQMLHGTLLLISMITFLDPVNLDEARLKAERAADANVLSSLQSNGDCASEVRTIDLRFIGTESNVAEFSEQHSSFGFTVIQFVKLQFSEIAIDVSVQSDTLASSIDRLTVNALKIEEHFDLRLDGWGTIATKCR
jgi:hypothetical protein